MEEEGVPLGLGRVEVEYLDVLQGLSVGGLAAQGEQVAMVEQHQGVLPHRPRQGRHHTPLLKTQVVLFCLSSHFGVLLSSRHEEQSFLGVAADAEELPLEGGEHVFQGLQLSLLVEVDHEAFLCTAAQQEDKGLSHELHLVGGVVVGDDEVVVELDVAHLGLLPLAQGEDEYFLLEVGEDVEVGPSAFCEAGLAGILGGAGELLVLAGLGGGLVETVVFFGGGEEGGKRKVVCGKKLWLRLNPYIF